MTENKQINKIQVVSKLKDEANIAKNTIFGANKPTELTQALETLVNIKEFVRMAKIKSKEITKDLDEQIKEANSLSKEIEKEIKNKVLSTYEEKVIVHTNEQTGEVKNIVKNNLGQKQFTYTPEKTTYVIDKDKILEDKSKWSKLVKKVETFTINETELNKYIEENGTKELPMKTIKSNAKFGIQFTQVLATMRKNKLVKKGENNE